MSAISPNTNHIETYMPEERMLVFGRHLSNVKILHSCFFWCGMPLMPGVIIGGGLIVGFLPPPHPYSGAEEFAQMFRENNMSIKYGIAGSFLVLPFIITFGIALAAQTCRIEGRILMLSYLQRTYPTH